jgi:hypothetical protein
VIGGIKFTEKIMVFKFKIGDKVTTIFPAEHDDYKKYFNKQATIIKFDVNEIGERTYHVKYMDGNIIIYHPKWLKLAEKSNLITWLKKN